MLMLPMCSLHIAHTQDLLTAAPGSGHDSSFQPAAHFRPMIDEVYNELCTR